MTQRSAWLRQAAALLETSRDALNRVTQVAYGDQTIAFSTGGVSKSTTLMFTRSAKRINLRLPQISGSQDRSCVLAWVLSLQPVIPC